MPVIPKLPHVNQNPTRVTKRMLNSKLKMENENLFIKRLPSKFISDALNTIHDFLLDEDRHTLVLVPKTHTELDFYRNCLTWCRKPFVVSKYGNEFQEVHHQISCLLLFRVNCIVNKCSSNKINESTGIKEVSYIKERKRVPIMSIPEPAQSMEAAVKPLNRAKAWTDISSSNCSSRGTSRYRSKKVAQAQNVAKTALTEISQSAKNTFQETPRIWRDEETTRKQQLKEAFSVPVQSDKAMRMMRGMGWSGGALGARGDGITEPLMPSLDLAKRAGLGHSRNGQSETTAKKPGESKTALASVSENYSASSETDDIVQKTKQLLL